MLVNAFKPLVYAIFLALAIFVVYRAGYSAGKNKVTIKCNDFKSEIETKLNEALEETLETERFYKEKIFNINESLSGGISETNANYQSIINDLRVGNRQLRKRFTESCASASGVPKDSGDTTSIDGGSGSGLLEQDAVFLIREARRADRTAKKLKACQNILNFIRRE